jgi:prepilin-type N-terminal cleavage/methylation domain-containing protein
MMTRVRRNHLPRAFSLIEVLLAIFILGVGVISIAALFPAGIAQQRASVDDSIGPTIANNAISLLRTKLSPDDFGTFEQFGLLSPIPTISGDFSWVRPGFIFEDDVFGATPDLDERGCIDIFSSFGPATANVTATEFFAGAGSVPLFGIPYNRAKYDNSFTPPGPPRILISQTERYYPAATQNIATDVAKPQYVWDCMFRRFQGKILVAIFVYRVTQPGGGGPLYVVAPNPANALIPPLPIWLDLSDATVQANSCAGGPWNPGGPDADVTTNSPGLPEQNSIVLGVPDGTAYDPDNQGQCWHEPRQWILDQNNNIHRVIGLDREEWDTNTGDVEVELVRPVPLMPDTDFAAGETGVYQIEILAAPGPAPDVVSAIWYLPVSLDDIDGNPLTLTPVYVTVKEL